MSSLSIYMMNIYMHEIITHYQSFLCKTFWVEVLNKLYARNVRETIAEPIRRFPHTSVSSICFCHLQ
jgi:hypothetical protein